MQYFNLKKLSSSLNYLILHFHLLFKTQEYLIQFSPFFFFFHGVAQHKLQKQCEENSMRRIKIFLWLKMGLWVFHLLFTCMHFPIRILELRNTLQRTTKTSPLDSKLFRIPLQRGIIGHSIWVNRCSEGFRRELWRRK